MIWLGLALIALGVALWPFRRERNRPEMDEAARSTAPGQFIKLVDGITHYEWFGPSQGPVVVCVHGLTTPSFVWKGIAPLLGALEYRVLIYDLYGRGYSDRPAGQQDSAFFLRQLNELLDRQGVTGDLTMFGYSMGGAIVTSFAAANPERIRQLVLLAPAGIRMPKLGWRARLGLRRGVGDWLMLLTYPSIHRKGTEEERDLPTTVPDIVELQQRELEFKGFVPAVLSSFRGLLSEPFDQRHRRIAEANTPVLTVLGEEDPLIPPSVADALFALNQGAKIEIIRGAGHGLPYTHTDEVMAHLRDFLNPKEH